MLGPLTAADERGPLPLPGPRHRAVLARLLVARGAAVPVARLVDDLWPEAPGNAVGAVQTFVGALRKALEPGRPPRTPSAVLVTEGRGYAVRAVTVDAWEFADAVAAAAGQPPDAAVRTLDAALALWRGPAYTDVAAEPWAQPEIARLDALRLLAIGRRAEALLALGRAAEVVPALEAHVGAHPHHEDGWRLLAQAIDGAGRRGDALAALRRARGVLDAELGIEPGPALRALEAELFASASTGAGSPRLEAVMGMVRALAVTGDLAQARVHRDEAIAAAEALGDPVLTARVIGTFDVPALWTRVDDAAQSARVVAAAERTLAALGDEHRAARARLLATIALERRADPHGRGGAAARAAEALARDAGDPVVLALALNGRALQRFERAGLAPERARIGAELVALASAHGLVTWEVLGHLVLVQTSAAVADLAGAATHMARAEDLAGRHELAVVGVFAAWLAALRTALTDPPRAGAAYARAAALLEGTGMTGLAADVLPLVPDPAAADPGAPAPGLLHELRTTLRGRAALAAGDRDGIAAAYADLLPAAGELAGAQTGLVTLGPVADDLARLADALGERGAAAEHRIVAAQVAERARAG